MDRKFFAGFVAGVVLTVLISREARNNLAPAERLTPDEASAQQIERKPELKSILAEAKPSRVQKLELKPLPVSVVNQEEKPGRQITLNSNVIREMEDAWNDIGQQIRLRREPEGLRIIELKTGSIFSRAGFVMGDLITNKAVESLRQISDGDQQLPERFERVLNHVTW